MAAGFSRPRLIIGTWAEGVAVEAEDEESADGRVSQSRGWRWSGEARRMAEREMPRVIGRRGRRERRRREGGIVGGREGREERAFLGNGERKRL